MNKLGYVKIKVCFAWSPEMMSNGEILWLTYYKKIYKYEKHKKWFTFVNKIMGDFFLGWNLIEKSK